jgi:hypothetical protein
MTAERFAPGSYAAVCRAVTGAWAENGAVCRFGKTPPKTGRAALLDRLSGFTSGAFRASALSFVAVASEANANSADGGRYIAMVIVLRWLLLQVAVRPVTAN